jgi:hypothetical protein
MQACPWRDASNIFRDIRRTTHCIPSGSDQHRPSADAIGSEIPRYNTSGSSAAGGCMPR